MNDALFPQPEGGENTTPRGEASREPRVQRPDRRQLEWRAVDLEGLLPPEHRARVVWEFVASLDLTGLYGRIKAVEGHAGRPPIDPAILLAVWLYATLEGVGSARALARLCEAHDAYRWLCGGVSVNYHTLAEFRVAPGAELDRLLTRSVAALMASGAVRLQRVAQDGLRVRASAGSGSFRRRERLAALLEVAEAHVQALRDEVGADPGAPTRRHAAAHARAVHARQQRVAAALAALPALEAQAAQRAQREGGRRREPRVSTTDADARVMKQADGGFRPSYNAQFATDTGSQVIVGVEVTTAGVDTGQLVPMLDQLRQRYGRGPTDVLVDGGYVRLADFADLAAPPRACTVYAPVAARRGAQPQAPAGRHRGDSDASAAWRARMATAEAQALYKERAATAECVNADARYRGLGRVLVRGVGKVRAVLLWFAIAHNLLRAVSLGRLGLQTA